MKLLAFITVVLLAGDACAQTIKLQWELSPDHGLTGYKVYYGRTTPPTKLKAAVGWRSNQFTFSNLSSGGYYFGVTAYNALAESVLSNIVSTGLVTKINAVERAATTQVVTLTVVTSNTPATIRYCLVNGIVGCTPSTVYSAGFRATVNLPVQTICVSATDSLGAVEDAHCMTIRKQVKR